MAKTDDTSMIIEEDDDQLQEQDFVQKLEMSEEENIDMILEVEPINVEKAKSKNRSKNLKKRVNEQDDHYLYLQQSLIQGQMERARMDEIKMLLNEKMTGDKEALCSFLTNQKTEMIRQKYNFLSILKNNEDVQNSKILKKKTSKKTKKGKQDFVALKFCDKVQKVDEMPGYYPGEAYEIEKFDRNDNSFEMESRYLEPLVNQTPDFFNDLKEKATRRSNSYELYGMGYMNVEESQGDLIFAQPENLYEFPFLQE